jgi:tetratricopeptide (TPR) repeat protein
MSPLGRTHVFKDGLSLLDLRTGHNTVCVHLMAPKQLFMGMLALAAASLAAGQDLNPPPASPAGATPTPSLNFGTPGANDAAFDSKFSLMGGKPTSQQRDQAFYDPPTVAGIAAIQKNDFKEGIAQMTKALELQPDNPIARGFRALAYMKTGEYTLSQADFDKVLAEVPADKRSDFLFSVAQLHWAEKRFDLVADDMTEVIKADAGNTNAWEVRSEAFANLKDDARSIADASEEIRLAPEAPTGYFERGIVYADAKRYDEALADLSEAIVLDPSIPQGFIKEGKGQGRPCRHPVGSEVEARQSGGAQFEGLDTGNLAGHQRQERSGGGEGGQEGLRAHGMEERGDPRHPRRGLRRGGGLRQRGEDAVRGGRREQGAQREGRAAAPPRPLQGGKALPRGRDGSQGHRMGDDPL